MTAASTRRRLIAGTVPDDFDPARDVALGPWCLADAQERFPDWEDLPFPDPVADVAAAKHADDALAALANRLLPEIGAVLNARHGVDHGTVYWHVLLMRWVLELLTQFYCRFGEAQTLLARDPDTVLVAMVPPAEQTWRFDTIAAFYIRGLRDVDFNAWLAGLALRAIAQANVEVRDGPANAPLPTPAMPAKPESWLRRLYRSARNGRVSFRSDFAEVSAFQRLRSVLAHAAIAAWVGMLPAKRAIIRPDPEILDTSAADTLPPEFVRLARFVLDHAMPRCFDDGFAAARAAAQSRRIRPGRLNVQVPGFMLDEPRLFRMARAIEGGEGLVFVQHGTNYGMASAYSLGSEIEYRHHAFITWGWSRHGDYAGRFVPLPAPQLVSWIDGRHGDDGTLLFTGTFVHMVMARLISVGAPFNTTWIRRQKDAFLDGLAPAARDSVRYRPYPEDHKAVRDWPYFAARHPGLQRHTGVFHESLRRCRLLVVDHPGLTFLLALRADIPVIGFWNPDAWARAPEAAAYFDGLQAAGIVFEDGAAAAEQVNRVWADVDAWWRRPEVREARAAFCREHLRASRWWWLHWMRALAAL